MPRDGRRNLGVLEAVVRRQWDPAQEPPPQVIVHMVDQLAALQVDLASRLADGLQGGLWLGPGHVPDLDGFWFLRGQLVRDGHPERWDDIPGAMIGDAMVIGDGDHVSASILHHEIGHFLDLADEMAARQDWQTIMFRCRPLLQADRYQDQNEWYAESFALVATGQIRRLARMLGGNDSVMEMVWQYHRHEFGLDSYWR